LRILYIAQFFNRPDEAGAGRHYAFATEWTRLGHEVTVITGQQNYRTGRAQRLSLRPLVEDVEGARILRTYVYTDYKGSFRRRYLNFASFAASSVMAALRAPRPDVVFASSPPLSVALAGSLVARLRGAPLVVDVRDLWPESALALGVIREGAFSRAAARSARRVYRRAKKIVAVTNGIVEGLEACGVPRGKIVKVTNGVDVALFDRRPEPAGLRASLGLADTFLCTYVGGMGILHDVETLVQAALGLRRDGVHFLLVGEGDDRPRLERFARERALTNVTFHEPLPKQRVPGVLAEADCAVYSLRNDPFFRGTFPNKNFDYLAAGRPVVLAVEGESAALVRAAGAGFVVAPGDPVALAAGIRRMKALAPGERAAMGERGRGHVLAHYRRTDLAAALERTLCEVAGDTAREARPARFKRGVA
jgi:glycosyltransferase involved in cell wall biosynthesis